MKKILLLLMGIFFCSFMYGQKITALPEVMSADTNSLIMVRSGSTGNVISKITKGRFLRDFEYDSAVIINDMLYFFLGGDTITLGVPVAGQTDITDQILVKTAARIMFSFVVGGGNPSDTLSITDSTILGSFYNGGNQTIVVDTLQAVTKKGEGLDTLAFNIGWTRNFARAITAPTGKVSNTQFNVGKVANVSINNTTGNVFTTFDTDEIPPGYRVYMWLPYHPADGLKRKPRYFEVSLIGHYK